MMTESSFVNDYDDDMGSNLTDENPNQEKPQDQIEEVQEASKIDTRRVTIGRIAVTVALVVTAAIVTVTSYMLLQNEEDDNFEAAVSR